MLDLNSARQINESISPIGFALRLFLTLFFSQSLNLLYVKTAYGVGGKRSLGRNLPIISMTTMLIISIVKSSLALSLGLVGALSIVRFRTAIKEPEELSYIFLSIAIGLGFGAGQIQTSIIGFVIITSTIFIKWHFKQSSIQDDINLIITAENSSETEYEAIISKISNQCRSISLQRLSLSNTKLEIAFKLSVSDYKKLTLIIENVKEISPHASVDIVENSSLFA